jgi:hypothetical protein
MRRSGCSREWWSSCLGPRRNRVAAIRIARSGFRTTGGCLPSLQRSRRSLQRGEEGDEIPEFLPCLVGGELLRIGTDDAPETVGAVAGGLLGVPINSLKSHAIPVIICRRPWVRDRWTRSKSVGLKTGVRIEGKPTMRTLSASTARLRSVLKIGVALFLVLVGAILSSCVVRFDPLVPPPHEVVVQAGPPAAEVVVNEAPPEPVVETVTVAPYPGYVWVGGYWGWRGGAYVWVPGRWHQPPRVGAVWVGGYWSARAGGGHVWVSGRWR